MRFRKLSEKKTSSNQKTRSSWVYLNKWPQNLSLDIFIHYRILYEIIFFYMFIQFILIIILPLYCFLDRCPYLVVPATFIKTEMKLLLWHLLLLKLRVSNVFLYGQLCCLYMIGHLVPPPNRLRRGIFAESTILSSLNQPRTNTEQFCQRENHVYKENHGKLKRLC